MAKTLEKSIKRRIKVLKAQKHQARVRMGVAIKIADTARNPATGEIKRADIKQTLTSAGILTKSGKLRSFDIKNG